MAGALAATAILNLWLKWKSAVPRWSPAANQSQGVSNAECYQENLFGSGPKQPKAQEAGPIGVRIPGKTGVKDTWPGDFVARRDLRDESRDRASGPWGD